MHKKSEECVFELLNQRESVCRFCFNSLEDKSPEFTVFQESILKMVQFSCPNLTLCENPLLPSLLCQSCFLQLQNCYQFLVNVHSSDTLLNKYLQITEIVEDSVGDLDGFCDIKLDTASQSNLAIDLPKTTPLSKTLHRSKNCTKSSMKVHGCPNCKKKYKSKYELEVHRRVHSGEKPFRCSVCQKAFRDNRNLKRHSKIHSEDKKHECPVCLKKFLHLFSLKTHQRIHTGEKHYVCEMCGKPFNTSGELTIHSRIHTRCKPYSCSICGKSFSSKSTLNNHMSIHTGDKRHTCAICYRKCRTSYDLKVHMRCHDNEKPYFCKYVNCGKTYRSNSQLNVHLRTHTGEKRHQCRVCLKKFGESNTLKRHVLTHGKRVEG